MERKLLLPIAMLLLFAFNTSAETVPDLPPLPVGSSVEAVEQNDGEDVSFWKKILNFFGFSKEKKEDIAEKSKTLPSAKQQKVVPGSQGCRQLPAPVLPLWVRSCHLRRQRLRRR